MYIIQEVKLLNISKKKKFNLKINVINEKEKILDTGGGVLNALKYFNESFLCINPDTIWSLDYVREFKKMENDFFLSDKNCSILVVKKVKSFDKNMKGDFNLKNNLINKENKEDLKYIYTGLQIMKPKIFSNINEKVFSMNKIWEELIKKEELFGMESNINFLHVSNLDIYKNLNIKQYLFSSFLIQVFKIIYLQVFIKFYQQRISCRYLKFNNFIFRNIKKFHQ